MLALLEVLRAVSLEQLGKTSTDDEKMPFFGQIFFARIFDYVASQSDEVHWTSGPYMGPN